MSRPLVPPLPCWAGANVEETTAACAERKGGHDAYGYDDVNRHDDDGEMTMMMLTMETIAVNNVH